MEATIESKKIVEYSKRGSNEKVIDVITTKYPVSFLKNINRRGRVKKDYEKLSDEEFNKCINNKIRALRSYNKRLDIIEQNNEFNYFLTIRGINKSSFKKILDRLRKADKSLQYVSLASWTISMDLHYHVLIKSNLSLEDLDNKLNEIDTNIKSIYDIHKLIKYLKKNLNYDTLYVLKQFESEELRDKQIEILSYSNILTTSKGIISKPNEIKNPTDEQLDQVYKNSQYLKSIEYKNIDSQVKIDKFKE